MKACAGCYRTTEQGASFRKGSAQCEACEESLAEVRADDAEKLEAAKALVARATGAGRLDSPPGWYGVDSEGNISLLFDGARFMVRANGSVLRQVATRHDYIMEEVADAALANAVKAEADILTRPAGAMNVVRAEHLAEAFHEVGKVNHYMVGVVGAFSAEELERAEQILISEQNAGPQKGRAFEALERALNAIEAERTKRLRRPRLRGISPAALALAKELVSDFSERREGEAPMPTERQVAAVATAIQEAIEGWR